MTGVPVKYCVVVDDDDAFRNSLVALLEAAGYDCRPFGSADSFLAEIERLPAGILLLDLRMPGLGGLEMLERGDIDPTRFAVVVISGQGDIERAVRSIKAGAIEFIEKPFEAQQLLALMGAAQATFDHRAGHSAQRRAAIRKVETLSPRETEVLQLLLIGASNKVVARALDLSVRTVEMHRAHMLTKLGARSTADALRLAMLAETQPWAEAGAQREEVAIDPGSCN